MLTNPAKPLLFPPSESVQGRAVPDELLELELEEDTIQAPSLQLEQSVRSEAMPLFP